MSEDKKAKIIIVMLKTSIKSAEKKKSEPWSEIIGFNSKPLTEEMVNGILDQYFPEVKVNSVAKNSSKITE